MARGRKDSKSTPLTNKKVQRDSQFSLEYAISFPVELDFVIFFGFRAVSQLP